MILFFHRNLFMPKCTTSRRFCNRFPNKYIRYLVSRYFCTHNWCLCSSYVINPHGNCCTQINAHSKANGRLFFFVSAKLSERFGFKYIVLLDLEGDAHDMYIGCYGFSEKQASNAQDVIQFKLKLK